MQTLGVRHPDDLKGLKLRTPSRDQAAIIKGLGAVPVAMPMPRTYGAIEKGVVDGALVGISVVNSSSSPRSSRTMSSTCRWAIRRR